MFFIVFWSPRPSSFEAELVKKRPQTDQKSSKKLNNIMTQLSINFGINLSRVWEGVGLQAATKLAPNATKTRPKTNLKHYFFLEGLQIDFGWILTPNLGAQGESKVVVGWLFWLLGPSWRQDGPKRPQGAQEAPKIASKTAFGAILIDFWLFLMVFG